MNCIEFETAAERVVETRQSPSSGMTEHLSSCAGCRQIWERQQQLDSAIAAWKIAQPRINLANAVLNELARPASILDRELDFTDIPVHHASEPGSVVTRASLNTNVPQVPSRSSPLPLLATAACLVIAILFAMSFSSNDRHELASRQNVVPATQVDAELPLDMSETLTAVISDLRSEYRDVATETTAIAREMVGGISPSVEMSPLATDAAELLRDSKDFVRMFSPIGDGVESALGFLWQALPSEIPAG